MKHVRGYFWLEAAVDIDWVLYSHSYTELFSRGQIQVARVHRE